jgi:integrase/recombinase XerD
MLAGERGAARNTLEAYRRDLQDFAAHLGGRAPAAATPEDIRLYLDRLAGAGLSAATTARRLSALRQFFGHLYAEGHIATDPTAALASPRRARPLPKTLGVADIDRLFAVAEANAAEPGASPARRREAKRMLALIELAYASGLRVSELVTLPRSAARARGEMLAVTGKGGKERLVPLHDRAKAALSAYIAEEDAVRPRASRHLFPADGADGHLSRQVFGRALKRLAAAAGIPAAKISPHGLRHAFASHLLQNGADLRVLQQLLGHADIATTQIYTHVLDERASAMVRDLHPMAERRGRRGRGDPPIQR